jgi:hypothetical protein
LLQVAASREEDTGMKQCAWLWAGACATGVLLPLVWTSSAQAQSREVGATYVDRPLVLPQGVLRIDAGPRRPFDPGQVWDTGQLQFHINKDGQDRAFLVPGAAYGAMDKLEVGVVWPMQLSPKLDLADISLYGKYLLDKGQVDIAGYAEVLIPIQSVFQVTVGVPVYLHINDTLRLDTGGFFGVVFADDVDVKLTVPLGLAAQVTPDVFLGPELAIAIIDFNRVNVPLGIFGGYTLRDGGRTLGDLFGRFAMVDLEEGFDFVRLDLGIQLYFEP